MGSYQAIEESSIYNTYENILEGQIDHNLLLSPQDHVYHYTKDHIFKMNLVFSYEFRPGSNGYLVYSVYRDVVGEQMNDFIQFIKYRPNEDELSEVNFSQSLYLKVDYWFDL